MEVRDWSVLRRETKLILVEHADGAVSRWDVNLHESGAAADTRYVLLEVASAIFPTIYNKASGAGWWGRLSDFMQVPQQHKRSSQVKLIDL